MDFARSGMLGVTVICIALAGALFGGYLAGVEAHEEPTIEYNFLADVSGLFDYDKSPQYIEFDSSTNYTGYHSPQSGQYFPENRVDYEPYSGVNNYRLDIEPDMSTETIDVSGAGDYSWVVWYETYYQGNPTVIERTGSEYVEYHSVRINHSAITDFLAEYDVDYQGDDKVRIRSADPAGQPGFTEGIQKDWIFVTLASDWTLGSNETMNYKCGSQQYVDARPSDDLSVPCLSCIIDFQTGVVERYYDTNFHDYKDTVRLDAVILIYGGQTPTITGNYTIELAGTVRCDIVDPASPKYLDPTHGVSLTGA